MKHTPQTLASAQDQSGKICIEANLLARKFWNDSYSGEDSKNVPMLSGVREFP